MMNVRIFTIAITLAACAATVQAGGKTVTVWQSDAGAVRGELLWIDSNLVLISPFEDATDAELLASRSLLTAVPTQKVVRMTTEGHSYVLAGLGIGAGVGLALGAVSAANQSSSGVPVLGEVMIDAPARGAIVLIGCAAGAATGLLVGLAASSHDETYGAATWTEVQELRLMSRYPRSCPLLPPPAATQEAVSENP